MKAVTRCLSRQSERSKSRVLKYSSGYLNSTTAEGMPFHGKSVASDDAPRGGWRRVMASGASVDYPMP